MKFVVVGTGGVGGYFGGMLARAGEEVWFVARGEHLRTMQSHGLKIESTQGSWTVSPGRMVGSVAEAGVTDVVLFCVKSYDTEQAAISLLGTMGRGGIVISLQNGVDNLDRIKKILPSAISLGGVVFIYSSIASPGVIAETGGIMKLTIGATEDAGMEAEKANEIVHRIQGCGIDATVAADIRRALWEKLVFISPVAGLTTLLRLPLSEILGTDQTRAILEEMMMEVWTVGRAAGIALHDGFVKEVLQKLRRRSNETFSSMYYDLTHKRPLEIEALTGTVISLGARHGVRTPHHGFVYAALLPHHRAHMVKRRG